MINVGTQYVKERFRELLYGLVRCSGVPLLIWFIAQRRKVTVVIYHDIEPNRLDEHLARLSRFYNFVSFEQFSRALQEKALARLPKYALVLTLDDGRRGNFKLLPIFKRHGIRPTIFLCSSIVGTSRHLWCATPRVKREEVGVLQRIPDQCRVKKLAKWGFSETREYPTRFALSKSEILSMMEFVDFQSHTRFHPIIPQCDPDRAWKEISLSRTELREKFGLDVQGFSFPNGAYTNRDLAFVRDAGYSWSVNVDPGFNGSGTDLYGIRRICLNDQGGVNETLVKVTGLPRFLRLAVSRIKAPLGLRNRSLRGTKQCEL